MSWPKPQRNAYFWILLKQHPVPMTPFCPSPNHTYCPPEWLRCWELTATSTITAIFPHFWMIFRQWCRRRPEQQLPICNILWWWIWRIIVQQCPIPAIWCSCLIHWATLSRTQHQLLFRVSVGMCCRYTSRADSSCRHWCLRWWCTWKGNCMTCVFVSVFDYYILTEAEPTYKIPYDWREICPWRHKATFEGPTASQPLS